MIEEKDRLLLSHLQKGLPLDSQPFAVLGKRIGLETAEVLLRVEKLRREGLLNEIKAFWNYSAFGYQGAWVAMRFKREELDAKARIIEAHPGVVYIAERTGDLDLWFFIAVPAAHDIEAHVRILEKQAVPEVTGYLPLREVLKGAGLLHGIDPEVYAVSVENPEKKPGAVPPAFLLDEIRIIRAMQDDFPVADEPFRKIAETALVPAARLPELLNGVVRKGYLKRIGAGPLTRTKAENPRTLVVWQVPEEKKDRIAAYFSEIPEIVHADIRPAYSEFPFSVHTLIMAKDGTELEVLVRRIEDGIGKWPHQTVELVREIKKVPLRYFPKDLDAWWVRYRSLADAAFDRVQA